jgi:hypothetical protein
MIHCIGNSHVNNFSNNNYITLQSGFKNDIFTLYHLGATIAYNFYEHHMPKVIDIIKYIDKKDYISLIVGEVDCRLHLPLQADQQNKTDFEIVNECINRLFRCYDYLIENDYNVIVFSTHPTTIKGHNMSDMSNPIYGSVERRNNICVLWNNKLKDMCSVKNIKYIDFYKYLVDENNITKMEYFLDYCHLNSNKIFPFLLKEMATNE